jgi:hypothetical protein
MMRAVESIDQAIPSPQWRQQMTAKDPSPSRAPFVIKTEDEITDTELDKVTGGKVHIHDMSFTRPVDVSSPVL